MVTRRSRPSRIVSLIRLSSTMWKIVVSGMILSAQRAEHRRQRRAGMNQC